MEAEELVSNLRQKCKGSTVNFQYFNAEQYTVHVRLSVLLTELNLEYSDIHI
jgi:hypothetical protein